MKFITPLLVGGAILTLGGPAFAQPAQPYDTMSGMQDARPRDYRVERPQLRDRRQDRAEMTARWTERLRDALQLTQAQQPAFDAYLATVAPPEATRQRLRGDRGDRGNRGPQAVRSQQGMRGERGLRAQMTTPQRLDQMRTRLEQRLVTFDRQADATLRLYGQLSPTQQQAFDAMPPISPGRERQGGPGRRGADRG